jgi:hypothetical protein
MGVPLYVLLAIHRLITSRVLILRVGANVPFENNEINEWNGGAVQLELHHPYSYVWLNVGLGENTTDFNITLTPQFWNVTGSGTVCVDDLPWPKDIANGTIGTLQVVTSDKGSALYNCADFRYNPEASGPRNCSMPEDVEVIKIKSQSNSSDSGDGSHDHGSHGEEGEEGSDSEGSDEGGDSDDAAGIVSLNKATLSALVAVGFGAAMLGL